MGLDVFILILLHHTLLAAVTALGFALLTHTPKRMLFSCATLGGVTYAIYSILLYLDIEPVWAGFTSATLVAITASYLAKSFVTSYKIFTVPAIIALLPITQGYNAILALVQLSIYGYSELYLKVFLNNFAQTSLIISALFIGLVLPEVANSINLRHKKNA